MRYIFARCVAHIYDHAHRDVLAGEFSLSAYAMRHIFARCGSHL